MQTCPRGAFGRTPPRNPGSGTETIAVRRLKLLTIGQPQRKAKRPTICTYSLENIVFGAEPAGVGAAAGGGVAAGSAEGAFGASAAGGAARRPTPARTRASDPAWRNPRLESHWVFVKGVVRLFLSDQDCVDGDDVGRRAGF